MKKFIAAIITIVMLFSFATVASASNGYPLGDINMDGSEPNTQDLVLLRKVLLDVEDSTAMVDVNGDGIENIIDLIRLKKIISNPASEIIITNENNGKTDIVDNWN